jgi:hypothetical protein
MGMTVKQVINKLKKMPQDSIVAIRDHDQQEHEISGTVEFIFLADTEDDFVLLEGKPVVILNGG